ncbi:hypothetical protein, partial [Gordonia amicalis]|uniref:hypothetical protein n=1 Tax=Gordonia amicalis TaxID=89053 RepID=UPI003A80C72B
MSDFATPEQRAAFREVVEGLAQSQIARAKHRELAETTKPKPPTPVNKPKTPHIFHGIDITDWTPEQKSKLRPWVPMGWDGNSEWNEDGTKRIGCVICHCYGTAWIATRMGPPWRVIEDALRGWVGQVRVGVVGGR